MPEWERGRPSYDMDFDSLSSPRLVTAVTVVTFTRRFLSKKIPLAFSCASSRFRSADPYVAWASLEDL
jgi:hypothetical protein